MIPPDNVRTSLQYLKEAAAAGAREKLIRYVRLHHRGGAILPHEECPATGRREPITCQET